MKKENTYLKTGIVLISLALISVSVLWSHDGNKLIDDERKIKEQNFLIDSLRDENFILNVENTRHEITRDEIFFIYPNVGKKYQEFYEHKTE
jgi:hypothetical protein